jgi:hypothetical protein
MLLTSLFLAGYAVDPPTEMYCKFPDCLITLRNSKANEVFELEIDSVTTSDETEIRQLCEYNHKIVKISFFADGIGYESLACFRAVMTLVYLDASKYTSEGLNQILTAFSPSEIREILVKSVIDKDTARTLLSHLRENSYKVELHFPGDTNMYNDPLYIELAQVANQISLVDISKISSENIQIYSNLISKVGIIEIYSIPETRQDIGNMNRLLAQANPSKLKFGSFDIYMQPGFKHHIRNYNRIYHISFTTTGREEIDTDLLKREIPRLLNSLNNVRKIRLRFSLAAGSVFREIQNAVRGSWDGEMGRYPSAVVFRFNSLT